MSEEPIQPIKRGRGRPRKNPILNTPAADAPAGVPEETALDNDGGIENLEAELSTAESPEALLAAAKRLAEQQKAAAAFVMPVAAAVKPVPAPEPAPAAVPETPVPAPAPVPAEQPERPASFERPAFPRASAINPVPRQESVPVQPRTEIHYPTPAGGIPAARKLPAWATRAPSSSPTLSRFASPRPSYQQSGAPAGTGTGPSSYQPRRPDFKKPYSPRFGAQQDQRSFAPNFTRLSYKDSLEVPALKLGERFDLNRLNDEEYLTKLSLRARHLKKIIRRELPPAYQNLNPNDPFARPEIGQIVEELVDDVPAEPLAFSDFYKLSPNKLLKFAQAMNVKNAASLKRGELILNIMKEAYVARRPIQISGTLDLLENNNNGLLLYRCKNYERVEFTAFVPAILIKKYNLKRGHYVKGTAFPPMPGETAPMIVDILEVEGEAPEKFLDLPSFSSLTPVYPDKRIRLENETLGEKGNAAMRALDLICPIGYGQRMLVIAPEGFDRAPLMHSLTCAISKSAPDAEISVLLIDAHHEDIAEFRKDTENVAVVASDFSMPDETHIHIAELTIEHARRRAELGKHTVVIIDSLTRLARAYNNLRSNGQKFISDTIDILTLVKPKRLFSSACNYSNGGSITIIATITNHSPNRAKEIIFDEFNGTGNAKITLLKKAVFPHLDIANSSNRRAALIQSEEENALARRIRKNTEEMPAAEALEALMNDIAAAKTNKELTDKKQ